MATGDVTPAIRIANISKFFGKLIAVDDVTIDIVAGEFLVIVGLLLAGLGVLLWSGLGRNWLGRLPGDIHYSKGNFSFYFPLMTCVLASLLLTLILWLFIK